MISIDVAVFQPRSDGGVLRQRESQEVNYVMLRTAKTDHLPVVDAEAAAVGVWARLEAQVPVVQVVVNQCVGRKHQGIDHSIPIP